MLSSLVPYLETLKKKATSFDHRQHRTTLFYIENIWKKIFENPILCSADNMKHVYWHDFTNNAFKSHISLH